MVRKMKSNGMFSLQLSLQQDLQRPITDTVAVCSLRQEKRAINHKHSSLEDGLEMLPLPDGKAEEEVTVPVTGQDIKDLDGTLHIPALIHSSILITGNADEKTSALLELYGIPSSTDMFLHEKKLAYLRFVGASRALMHLVLD